MNRLFFSISLTVALLGCTASPPVTDAVATGMLKTREYIVIMYASLGEPLYSVHSPDGTLLEQDLNMETMVARYPDLEYLRDNDAIDWAGIDNDLRLPVRRPVDQ